MSIYSIDYETTSACDISLGGYRYACDPSTRILMFAIAKDDGEPLLWSITDKDPEALAMLQEAIETRSPIYSHNAQFELAVSTYRMLKDIGIEPPHIDQWRCTLAMCRRAAAPESLAEAAKFFGLNAPKDPRGKALIGVFSDQSKAVTLTSPTGEKVTSSSPILDSPVLWDWAVQLKGAGVTMTVREAWELFCDYCRQDVRVEQELHHTIKHFELRGDVLASFQFDLRMNWRGVPVNVPALKNAREFVARQQEKLGRQFKDLTGLDHTQRGAVQDWLQKRGYQGDNMQAATVDAALENPESMTPEAQKALKLRSGITFAALAKIPAMIESACPDGRVRGTTQWHAARTGRAGGRIIQPQNFRKSTIGGQEHLCYKMLCEGWDDSWIEEMWDSPLEAVASSIRHFIQPAESGFYDLDYAGVEARITPWLAGDTDKLDFIASGGDPYKRTASMVFSIPYEQVEKWQRTIAKPIELGCCIAEGELVLTPRGEIPIEKLLLADLVWDGVEWVSHEGVIYQGEREVITYQGLTATPDHKVWVEERSGKLDFSVAHDEGYRLVVSGKSRTPIRRLDVDEPKALHRERIPQANRKMQMWRCVSELCEFTKKGVITALRCLSGSSFPRRMASVACSAVLGSKGEVRKSCEQAISPLRRAWRKILVRFACGSGQVDDGKSRTVQGIGNRPSGQRRALRSRQHEVVNQARADVEQSSHGYAQGFRVPPRGMAVLRMDDNEEVTVGQESRRGAGGSVGGSKSEKQKLDGYPKKVRVYDILNAGPRRRFTVSGKLVSNCFMVGARGLRTSLAGAPYFIDRSLTECRHYVKTYRDGHPQTIKAWRDIEEGAKYAIKNPGKTADACDGKLRFQCGRVAGITYLTMRLPSGRKLYYPHPTIKATWKAYDPEEMKEEPWKYEDQGYWIDQISFYGKITGKSIWGRVPTWSGRLFENAVQSIGADLLNRGCIEAERRGYPICMIVHDQALCEQSATEGSLEGFTEALCVKDEWSMTFPLEASGEVTPYYMKEQ